MNKKQIVAVYETTLEKVNKILRAAGLDHNAPNFSRNELNLFDETWTLVETDGMSITDATKEMKRRETQANDPAGMADEIDPSIMAIIREQSAQVAKQFANQAPEAVRRQQKLIEQYFVKSFLENFAALAKSGELKKSFDRVLTSDVDVLEAAVLPGEPPVLPESSSSGI